MLIKLEDATVEYSRRSERFNAVDHVDLQIDTGDFVTIMGKSGSGKTTLMNLIAGAQHPTSGKVVVAGSDISSFNDREASRFRNGHIGYVPQSHGLLASLTVMENVLLPAQLHGSNRSESDAKAVLERLGISDLADSFPRSLSGGEQRRASIARALINSPDVILADEPTSDLDRDNTETVMRLLTEINREGTTVIVVTHEYDAAVWGRKLYYMESGRIRDETYHIADLRQRFTEPFRTH